LIRLLIAAEFTAAWFARLSEMVASRSVDSSAHLDARPCQRRLRLVERSAALARGLRRVGRQLPYFYMSPESAGVAGKEFGENENPYAHDVDSSRLLIGGSHAAASP
jgi:hypothetical protein